jgi:aryl-alcohol dehydrogenase-like predicted oxidoreductase
MTMEHRFLGRSGLELSVLGFGAMTFGDGQAAGLGVTDLSGARRQVDRCIDAGINLFDTADIYSRGRSEEILGEALGARRPSVIVATKAFGTMGRGPHDRGLSRRHLIDACDSSLRRLGTDWIDLYQLHCHDALVPIEETLRALDDLVRAGKIRYVGCSNYAGWQLMKALATADRLGTERFIGQQIQYSLLARDAENELLPCGVSEGVGALIWSPLAQGYLSGKFSGPDGEATETRIGPTRQVGSYHRRGGEAIVALLREIAADHDDATPSQVALNWVRARPGVSSVLIGARSDAQLEDNIAAATWTLAPEEIERLDRVSQPAPNYPNSHQRGYHIDRNPQLFPRH